MIDSHCHLTDPRLTSQLASVLTRAADAGVSRIITIGTDPPDWAKALELCARVPNVRCAIGVHPNHSHQVELSAIDQLRPLTSTPSVVAVGEMGLDYHYDDAPKDCQKRFFEAQLQLAADLRKPVVIHCREAVDDCLAILAGFPHVTGVFHCFTGKADEARRILDRGFCLGFTGVVTFKNAGELRDIARFAPADQILVETDAPYLAPEPVRREKVNEPAYVMHTARAVAAARGISPDELDRITTANVERLFGWSGGGGQDVG